MSIERIDTDLCDGCGICVDTCPMDVVRLDTLVSEREEYPPCRLACPAGVNMRRYIYFLREGMLEEAVSVLREALPMPAITGRICPHPCEAECARNEVDKAVNISALERFVADLWLIEKASPSRLIYAAKVAVVGSGPAGLACAYDLAKMGYPVTVFEAMSGLGGMLRIGVPEYRLPRDILEAQINYIRDTGVTFQTDTTVGNGIPLDELKEQGYQAVFYATGNGLSKKMAVDGVELDGVGWALEFLKAANLRCETGIKDRVLVIGGGDVALDVATMALRLGAREVQLACLEAGDEMPAHAETVKEAIDEGISINTGWGIKKITGAEGKVTGAELVRCTSVFDASGVFCPSYDEKETRQIATDMVILAIGQETDISFLPDGMAVNKDNTINVNPITLETGIPGIFAGGDAVASGPKTVVAAFAAGRKAAISIDRYLKGDDLSADRDERHRMVTKPPRDGMETWERQETPYLPPNERKGNFREIKAGFNEEQAIKEAHRCMTCGSRAVITYLDDCMLCDACEVDCPQKAIYVSPLKCGKLTVAWG